MPPVFIGTGLWDAIDTHVKGYFKYYDRLMPIPNHGMVNQVDEWKKYLASQREIKNQFGEIREKKGDMASQAETRATFTFPAFYDPLTDAYEPFLLIIKDEFRKFGYGDFPQTRTVEGKRQVHEFHRRYKDLFAIAEKL